MFDSYTTVVGTVLNAPDWRRVQKTGTVMTTFRVASHPRRFDRQSDRWVDAPSLRIKVTCWRRLAEGVAASLMVGDPVVVYGRITTRDWKTEQGENRVAYELEAVTVGHDLSRGQSKFQKVKLDTIGTLAGDEESDARVNGELTEPVKGLNATRLAQAVEESFDDFTFADHPDMAESGPTDLEAMEILRNAGLITSRNDEDGVRSVDAHAGNNDPGTASADSRTGNGDGRREGGGEDNQDNDPDDEEMVAASAGSGGSSGRGRRRGRHPVPA
jgi:single-strand DNA-binding protein